MQDEVHCSVCGRAVPAAGLCPGCLLRQGLSDVMGRETGPGDAGAPSLAEIQALFPQLEIRGCLGQGGMGTVYEARQPALNRLVALKVLRVRPGSDPEFLERFRREAQVMGRLNHPNIVAVYDFGEAGGLPYLVMERVEGEDLRTRMAARRLTPREAMNIALALCDALEAAHEQGIVHRDIKPANILLDKAGRVKVADFGLAKLASDFREDLALTVSGQAMGTPFYMAPEQHSNTVQADSRADLYAAGVILYEMLAGELPLGHFPAPSARAGTPVSLDAIILQAMESNAGRRFQRAQDLKKALLEVILSEPLSAWEPGARRRRRLPLIALAAFAAAAVTTALLLLAAAYMRKLPVPRDVRAFEDHYYKVFIEHVSWEEARHKCERMGGCLAIVNGPDENEFLAALSRCHVWLGARTRTRGRAWAWGDGSPLAYSNWEEGEPNNAAGRENCLMMTKYGKWNDLAEDSLIIEGYICEWDRSSHPGPIGGADLADLHAALRAENPAYDGSGIFKLDKGVVTEAVLTGPGIRSLSALRGLRLTHLDISWSMVTDLSPLRGMPLTSLDLTRSCVTDLAPLAGLPLNELRLEGVPIRDLAPLKGAPLKYLDIGHSMVTDLSLLRGMPLEELHMNCTQVKSLAPLAGLPLRRIGMLDTPVEDLSPLQSCPHLQMADVPAAATNLDCLAVLPELRSLNGRAVGPAAGNESARSNAVDRAQAAGGA